MVFIPTVGAKPSHVQHIARAHASVTRVPISSPTINGKLPLELRTPSLKEQIAEPNAPYHLRSYKGTSRHNAPVLVQHFAHGENRLPPKVGCFYCTITVRCATTLLYERLGQGYMLDGLWRCPIARVTNVPRDLPPHVVLCR